MNNSADVNEPYDNYVYSTATGGLMSNADFIAHAENTIKQGLRNSDGWNEIEAIEYHLTAPLP